MTGDDTTPDPLFKNVPRRPRTADSADTERPLKAEPDGGDPGGRVVSNASAPATPATASKKRTSSTVGDAENVPRSKKNTKNHGGGALDRHNDILGGVPQARSSHKDNAAAAAALASSSEAEPAVEWAENERRRKGKMPSVNEGDDACAVVARRPTGSGHGKLLCDAIRSHGSTAVAGSKPRRAKPKKDRTKAKKAMKDSSAWFWCGMGRDRMSSAGSDADYSFDRICVVSDRLRTTLRGLGVAAPERVYGKLLARCDRAIQQTRLQMSCKRWLAANAEFPLCTFLTEEEWADAHGKGLALTTYDRGGDAYELTFRFVTSNGSYRLLENWSDFLRSNGLVIGEDEPGPIDDVMLDLWLFRPPGGKIGMVMLHYRTGDNAAHADAALDEVDRKRLQLQLNNGGDGGNGKGNDDEAVMEDVVCLNNGGDGRNGNGNDDDAVIDDFVGAAPAPSSSPSELDGGGAPKADKEQSGGPDTPSLSGPDGRAKAAAKEQTGALGEVADAPSSSEQLDGGGAPSEVAAPYGMEEEQKAGTLMAMVLEVEAATQTSSDSDASGAADEVDNGAGAPAGEVAAAPSLLEAGGGAAVMVMEEEDEVAAALVEAAARSWKVTMDEFQAAQGLVMLSKTNS